MYKDYVLLTEFVIKQELFSLGIGRFRYFDDKSDRLVIVWHFPFLIILCFYEKAPSIPLSSVSRILILRRIALYRRRIWGLFRHSS